jgi:methionine-rich copper-binding protein CopC
MDPLRLYSLLAAGAVALGAWTMPAPRPALHNRLVKALPAVGDTIARAPARLELWFAEKPDVALSSVRLRPAADSTRILPTGKLTAGSESRSIAATVDTTLAAGGYLVSWRTASADGHIIKGQYRFQVGEIHR